MYKGILVGHSFVKSLSDYLVNPNPKTTSNILRVNDYISDFYLAGYRGARVTNPETYTEIKQVILHNKPNFVILEIGSNDLSTCSPRVVSDRVVELALALTNYWGINCVLVCSLLLRRDIPDHLISATNTYLHDQIKDLSCIKFHPHKKLLGLAPSKFSKDGIHVNTETGRELYLKSIRRAIFTCIKFLKVTNLSK